MAEQPERAAHSLVERRIAGVVARDAREVEQRLQGSLHLERGLVQQLQPRSVLRAGGRILEQEIHEADRAEEGVGDVVRDIRRQVAERGCPGERDERALGGRPSFVRQGK